MKNIKFIFLFIFFASVFFSCKKYPEGGNTYQAKSKVEGYWSVESLTVSGIDSTVNIKASPYYCEYPVSFIDINDHDDPSLLILGCFSCYECYWELSKDKKLLLLNFEKDTLNGELFPIILNENIGISWEIEKLNDKTMWIKTILNNKEYYFKLNKKPE